MAPSEHKLTPKQALFVQLLPTVNFNATEAYRQAGYACISENVACVGGKKLLTIGKIQAALAQAKAEIARRNELSQDWVVSRLMKNAERSLQEVHVLDKEGNPTGDYQYEGSVANRALELLGKHVQMWPEKELPKAGDTYNISVDARTQLASATVPELVAMLEQMRAKRKELP